MPLDLCCCPVLMFYMAPTCVFSMAPVCLFSVAPMCVLYMTSMCVFSMAPVCVFYMPRAYRHLSSFHPFLLSRSLFSLHDPRAPFSVQPVLGLLFYKERRLYDLSSIAVINITIKSNLESHRQEGRLRSSEVSSLFKSFLGTSDSAQGLTLSWDHLQKTVSSHPKLWDSMWTSLCRWHEAKHSISLWRTLTQHWFSRSRQTPQSPLIN